MPDYRLFFLGDDAVAIQPNDRALRHPLARALRGSGQWIDTVPGKEVVAVHFDPLSLRPAEAMRKLEDWLSSFSAEAIELGKAVDLHLDCSAANAPDLQALADQNGLTPQELLERVTGSDLVVDMLGFTPGFAYVEGVDPALKAERLAVPRQRVAAGSVGLVSGQLGLYGLSGPGGWPIIGRLTETLFDPARAAPFLLEEGQVVRIHLVDV
jgi:KipI family sensor histidine kinase inhibitor